MMADVMAAAEAVVDAGGVAAGEAVAAADRGGSQILSLESKPRHLRGFLAPQARRAFRD